MKPNPDPSTQLLSLQPRADTNAAPDAARRHWLQSAGSALGLLAAGAALNPARAQAGAEPSFYSHFAGMRLQDQNGRVLELQSLLGKVVLFNFIFTACSTVCPVQTHALAQMQAQLSPALRRAVRLVSVSLDPLSDTPQTLKAFAQRFKVEFDNWSFVTGRPDDIHRLAEALWLFRSGKGKAPLEDHTTSLWLVDGKGTLKVRYAGNPPDTARLTRELGVLVGLTQDQDARQPERANPNFSATTSTQGVRTR